MRNLRGGREVKGHTESPRGSGGRLESPRWSRGMCRGSRGELGQGTPFYMKVIRFFFP